jgi:phage shock protein C
MTTTPRLSVPEQSGSTLGPRRLTRSKQDRKIAGVCGGIAAYVGIDANVIRLITVALALFGGSGLVLYLIAWLLIPETRA